MAEPRTAALTLADPPATERFGRAMARALLTARPPVLVVFLEGEIGAGKTAVTRALLAELGHAGRVPSPTYTLVEPYSVAGYRILHVDLYRLKDPGEVEYLGLNDELGPGSVLLVEWPEQFTGQLPALDLRCALEREGSGRRLQLTAVTATGEHMLRAIQKEF